MMVSQNCSLQIKTLLENRRKGQDLKLTNQKQNARI